MYLFSALDDGCLLLTAEDSLRLVPALELEGAVVGACRSWKNENKIRATVNTERDVLLFTTVSLHLELQEFCQ
jgi:hypothetical protein